MKILQLRFKNLNSLEGEWEIDFTAPLYHSDGIFAISGPTGAGKSTIMDAICLALYGRTPRLATISGTTNEIMSRRTGECFAEVVFETQKGIFRSHWSQIKARKSPDGNLQQPKFEVSEYESGTVIASQIKTTLLAIEERTGMDFSRFTQSMMLAQGGFAAFLQADANERAPILEEITGTEIYSTVSKMVFDRNKEEKAGLELLQAETKGILILTEEELIKLQQEQNENMAVLQIQTSLKKVKDEAILWITTIENLRAEIASVEKEETLLLEELTAFVPERVKLEKAVKAFNIEADYVSLTNVRISQKKDTEDQTSAKTRLPALKAKSEEAVIACEKAATDLAAMEKTVVTENVLITKVRAIDVRITGKKQELNNAAGAFNDAEKQKKTAEELINNLQKQRTDNISRQTAALNYLNEHKEDEALITQLGEITASLKNLKEADANVSASEKQLKILEEELAKLNVQLVTDQNTVIEAKKNAEKTAKTVADITNDINGQLKGRPSAEYRNELNLLNRQLLLIRTIESLETERTKLEDGKVCPLCGSVHHPYAVGNIPVADETVQQVQNLTQLLDLIDGLNTTLTNAEKDESNRKGLLTQAEAAVSITQNRISERNVSLKTGRADKEKTILFLNTVKEELLKLLHPFGFTKLPDEEAINIYTKLRNRLNLWNENQQSKTSIDLTIAGIDTSISTQKALLESAAKSVESKEKEKLKVTNELTALIKERKILFGEKSTSGEEIRLRQQLDALQALEKQAITNRINTGNEFTNLNRHINELGDAIRLRSITLTDLETRFVNTLLLSEFVDEAEFNACRMPPESRNNLQQRANSLDEKQQNILLRKNDRKTKLEIETVKKLTEEPLDDLKQQSEDANALIIAKIARNGAISNQLISNRENQLRIGKLLVLADRQKIECLKWSQLNEYIGSADGKKFRNFAQGLTFEIMVSHANKQLTKLTDRYLLIRDKVEPLNLNVIDNYQAGELRSTKNLSGGESFLISLALALGLSKMSSKNVRVDSLFLDEGFGTLDEETLETALETLATLQQDGKLIGIISHVSSLKERINAKIEVVKGTGGKSIIQGPGCRRI